MIFFVDEEIRKLRALKTELKFSDFESEILRNADLAFGRLCSISNNEVDLVIIDVMLGVEVKKSKFNRVETDDFKKTGLLLLEHLIQQNPEVFPKKAVFLSNASSKELVSHIELASKKHGVPFLSKHNFKTPFDFVKKIEEIIQKING